MNPNPQAPQYSIQQLQDYLKLTIFLTGQEPKELSVSQEFFNFFREARKQVLKNFNSQDHESTKDEDQKFMGVKLIPILPKIETK